jgi:hypothetical protein
MHPLIHTEQFAPFYKKFRTNKMKSKSILLFIASLLIASSCDISMERDTEEQTSTVKVFVTTNTGEPINGVSVDLKALHGYARTPNGSITDTNGIMAFEYVGPKSGSIGIGYGGSYSYGSYGGYDYIQPFYQKQHTMQLTPRGWIKLHVKNENPWNGDDFISITVSTLSIGYGGLTDITQVHRTGANGVKTIKWHVRKNNISTHFSDTIYIPTEDTAFYEILY